MAYAIPKHPYTKVIKRDFIVTGRRTYLWGVVERPIGYWKEEVFDICRLCGESEYTATHGYPPPIDRM